MIKGVKGGFVSNKIQYKVIKVEEINYVTSLVGYFIGHRFYDVRSKTNSIRCVKSNDNKYPLLRLHNFIV